MSRISRYQESVLKTVTTKSSFCDLIKISDTEFIDVGDHEASIALLTILNSQNKKLNMKLHHGYYMGSGIDLLMLYNKINDNRVYYVEKYGEKIIKNIQNQTPIHVYECLHQNIETLENFLDKDKILKVHRKISTYVKQKLTEITTHYDITGTSHMHKTDIINFKFTNPNEMLEKYKKLKLVDKDILIDHINKTYGATCQCAFVVGWLLGLGDQKMINNLEKLGLHMGIIIKLADDFVNLERDIKYSDKKSMNMLVNYGVYHSFDLFSDSKTKLIEGTLTMGIYNTTIKEVIDFIEKKFDMCLNNTDLGVESKYSSFSNMS